MPKNINIRELARICGVSPATVSRVISGNAPVQKDTRLKIEQAMETYGYQPRQSSRQKGDGHTRTIGVVVPILNHAFFQFVLSELNTLLQERGDDMIIFSERTPQTVEQIKKVSPDGIILLNEEIDNRTIQRLLQMRISTVICGALSLSRVCPSVHVDDLAAAYDGTNYLLDLGHRKIGFICDSPHSISSGFQRITGSRKAIEDRGLVFHEKQMFTRASDYASGYDGVRILMSRIPDLTAIFAHSDASAIGAIAALTDLGFRVPGDISVLGFDDINLGREIRPRLTCVSQPIHDIAAKSLELLYEGMGQSDWESPPSITLPHSITTRESCRSLIP